MECAIPLFPERTLHLLLLTGLGAEELALLASDVASHALDVALLDPSLTPSPRCVASAAAKALLTLSSRGRPVAGTLHGDLVRCLLGTKSVGDAHRLLACPRGGAALLAVIDAARGIGGVPGGGGSSTAEANLAALAARAGGVPAAAPAAGAAWFSGGGVDAAAVAAAWRVPPAELQLGVEGGFDALEAAVLVRIGCGVDVA
jgi:hypothetical protein